MPFEAWSRALSDVAWRFHVDPERPASGEFARAKTPGSSEHRNGKCAKDAGVQRTEKSCIVGRFLVNSTIGVLGMHGT